MKVEKKKVKLRWGIEVKGICHRKDKMRRSSACQCAYRLAAHTKRDVLTSLLPWSSRRPPLQQLPRTDFPCCGRGGPTHPPVKKSCRAETARPGLHRGGGRHRCAHGLRLRHGLASAAAVAEQCIAGALFVLLQSVGPHGQCRQPFQVPSQRARSDARAE